MTQSADHVLRFLEGVHPYDRMPASDLAKLADQFRRVEVASGAAVYQAGAPVEGLYLIERGELEVTDARGATLSILGPRNSFGERGLLRNGTAVTSARALTAATLLLLPAAAFHALHQSDPILARFFDRARPAQPKHVDLATSQVATLMTKVPLTCRPDTPAREAAQIMAEARVSSLCVTDQDLQGIITLRDLSGKILGAGLPPSTPVGQIMTATPLTLPPTAIGSDVLHLMLERNIGHVPIVDAKRLVGIVTQTDLTRAQAISSASLVADLARADTVSAMADVTARLPKLLAQLVGAGLRHDIVTRLISDVADTATRRLLAMAEDQLGPPPVPYLWLACGSQGRQEQTGVSDQDNCLILSDRLRPEDEIYFKKLARTVCIGLDTLGYVFCPGEMMAAAHKWRQKRAVWRGYFTNWIAKPSPQAQLLASVMFDLRPIGGDFSLYEDLQSEVLTRASRNSIFVAHMVSNALQHTPPLGLLRGLATIRSGEHRNTLDMKHSGTAPVVDLARIFALQGRIAPVNTRARLRAAIASGALSRGGGRDLLDAYDLIATNRLHHQVRQIQAGSPPDNYLSLPELSDFDRSHLRDAFVVVKAMQAALGYGRGGLT